MPYHHKATSPKQQREQRPAAAWLGGGFTHSRNSSPSYGIIPVPVPWYAVGGLGYQQHHHFPSHHPHPGPLPSGVVFAEEPSSQHNMGASPEQQEQEATATGVQDRHGVTEIDSGSNDDIRPVASKHDGDEAISSGGGGGGTLTHSSSSRAAVPPEPQTDHTLRSLSRQLQEAIALCEGYLQEHESNIEAIKAYLDVASRDRLWAGLLESKFRNDEGSRHMLRSLPFEVDLAVRQALHATQREKEMEMAKAGTSSASNKQEDLDRCEKRAHEIDILRLRCGRVITLAGMALITPNKCTKMIEEMMLMQQTIDELCTAKTE